MKEKTAVQSGFLCYNSHIEKMLPEGNPALKAECSCFRHPQKKGMLFMIEYRYDTQLLIEGTDLDEDEINDYFVEHFKGDCLLAVGDEELIKIHYHTNEPWLVLEYCRSLGEIFDIVVEDMDRQARGLHG